MTLDFDDGELAVLGGLTRFDATELCTDGIENVIRAVEHARGGGANLNKMLSNGFPTREDERCLCIESRDVRKEIWRW